MFPSDRERESQYDILLALGIINLKFLNVLKLQRRDVGAGAEKMFCIEAGTSELSQFLLISPDITTRTSSRLTHAPRCIIGFF